MRTIRARVHNGNIEPLENLDLEEGIEVLVTILIKSNISGKGGFEKAAGSWAGSFDADEFIKNIYKSRAINTREAPEI